MPHVEKKDLLKYRLLGCLPQDQSPAAWLEWVVVFIGRAKCEGERVFLISDYL
jgi:hypothetical protein